MSDGDDTVGKRSYRLQLMAEVAQCVVEVAFRFNLSLKQRFS